MDEFPQDQIIPKGAVEYVYTTHVTHQELFYVHLDSHSSILEEIMDALESRYTQLTGDDKILTNVKLGGLCAAKFTDDKNWYRAKITGLIQNGLVEVQFVDYGNTDYVTRDRIKVLDPDLLQYPVQSYRCALAGVSCEQGFWPPELMVQFEDLVMDKRCKAVFQGKHSRDSVYLIDMYDEEGNHLNRMFGAKSDRNVQADGDMSVTVTVNQNGNELSGFHVNEWKVGDKIQASVVYVENPNLFWCQDVAFLNNIIILSEELSRLHMTQEMKPLRNIKPGAICAAKFAEDEAWYRGVIKSVSKNNASVYFVDYGNTENVELDSICNLKEEYRDLPALATRCTLAQKKPGNKPWSQTVINEFESLVMDREFEVSVIGRQGLLYEVNLLDIEENKEIGSQLQQFVSHESSKAQTPLKEKKPPATQRTTSSNIDLPVGSVSDVFLSWVDNPGDFWVQRADYSHVLDKLSTDLQEYYAQPRQEAMSERGRFVISRFSEDQQWYRALVVKEMDSRVQVLFIDYGNTDTVPKSELRQASPHFGDIDPLAFQCSLIGVKPLHQDNTWSVDAKHFLEEFTENGCQCEVIRKGDGYHKVKLTVEGKDVASELVSLAVVADTKVSQSVSIQPNYFTKTKLTQNQSETVFVSHVDSPHNIWVQLSRNAPQLDGLMEKLDSHYSEDGGTPISKPSIGQACVAQYSADNAWYRAVLLNISSAGYEVRFVDYGNSETVSPRVVCVPEPRFLDVPPQALDCSLSLPGNQDITTYLTDLILEKELQMKVLSITGSKAVIELFEGAQSITDLLKQQNTGGGGLLKITPAKNIPLNSTVNAFASVVLTPSKFFLQMAGIDDELASLMNQVTKLYTQREVSSVSKPSVGTFCVALYEEDKQWYRGKITAVQGNQCNVLFVDYGNEELINNSLIKELSSEISGIPILAYECCLDGVTCEAWTESAIEFFESLVMDQELSCTFMSSRSVHIVCNGENVADKLVKAGHGKSHNVSTPSSPSSNKSGGWKDKVSPGSGSAPGWENKPAKKSGFDESPRKPFGESRGFGGGRRDSGDAPERSPRKGGWDKDSGGFGKRDGGFRNQRTEFGSGDSRDRKPSSSSSAETFQYNDPPTEPEDALLVHIDADGTFYLQLLSREKDILFLAKRLAGSYKSGGPRLKETPVKGTVCCSKFEADGSMYRCLVEDVKGEDVLVRFVDYGNNAKCHKGDLKFLFPDLLQHPVEGYPCKLKGLTWSLDKAELFGKATLDKDLKVTFASTTSPFLVNIATPDGDLLDIMEGRATVSAQKQSPKQSGFGGGLKKQSFGGSSKTPPKSQGFSKQSNKGFGDSSPKQGSSGSPFKKALNFQSPGVPSQIFKEQSPPSGPEIAYISHISDDGYFYIQLDKDTAMLDKISDKLAALSDNTPHPNFSAGSACAAVFTEDSVWYRAKILCQETDKYKVCFIDYGNGDRVAKSSIRPLTHDLLESAPLCYKCQLVDCEPLPEEAKTKLSEYLLEHQITVQFENKQAPFSISAKTADGQSLQDIVYPSNKFRPQCIPDEVTPAGVSHIEADGRFFLQFYRDFKALDELQTSLEAAYSANDVEILSSLEKEMPCCVKSPDDEKWYRAKIVEVVNSNAQVCHVDFGQCETAKLENVKVLLPDFIKRPPYALECRLKGVDRWTEDLRQKFTEMTIEKILNATFYSKTPPYRVSLARSIELDLLGLKGPIMESPTKTSPVADSDASVSLSVGESANITEIGDDGHFFIQMASREEELQQFSEKLEASLESATPLEEVEEGQLLCAKFSEDEAWYRARVEKTEDGKHMVRFIDYGNTDCLEKTSLVALPADMGCDSVAPFAFKSELACEPKLMSGDLVEKLRNLVTDKMVTVEVVSEADGLHVVQVYLDGQAVCDHLGLQKISTQGKANASMLPVNMVFGENAYITEIGDDGHFFIQMTSREEELQQFSEKLEASLESATPLEEVEEGQLVCAKFSEDEAWYRARVEKIEDGKHIVRFIDYGNTDCLEKTSLAALPADMGCDSVAPFAFKSELACEPKLTSGDLVEKLRNLVTDKTVTVQVVSDIDDGRCMVQVYVESQALTGLLGLKTSSAKAGELSSILETVDNTLDINSNALCDGERVSVLICFVIHPNKFYIQFEKNQSALDTMMDELFEYASNLPEGTGLEKEPKTGDLLAALYEDESWYRVRMTGVNEDGSLEVFYVDHGNTEVVTDKSTLRQLPAEFKELPLFSKEASLFGIKPVDTEWTDEAIEFFKSMVEDKSMIADISSRDDVPCMIQLLDMGTPVHQTLMNKGYGVGTGVTVTAMAQRIFSDASESVLEDTKMSETDSPMKRKSGKIGCVSQSLQELEQVTACVSHCDNPSQFWCQLVSSEDALDEISDSLQKAYGDQLTEGDKLKCSVVPGDIVAALFEDDKLYYRSIVLCSDAGGESEGKYSVRFMDYGNCGLCLKEDVLKLRDDFYKFPAQAFQCSLDSVIPMSDEGWSEKAVTCFSDLVNEQEVLLKLVGRKQNGTALVDLVMSEDETSIAKVLIDENLAKPSESRNAQSKLTDGGKDISGMETLEITQPIMESTAMINETNSMICEEPSLMSTVSLEQVNEGHYKVFKLRLQSNYDVIVSDDELPNAFCVQLKDCQSQYKSLLGDIAEYIKSGTEDSGSWVAKLDEPCLIKREGEWHRCVIQDRKDKENYWSVRLVDVGYHVLAHDDDLKEIPEKFLELPTQAVPCYLAGIVSIETDWNTDAISFFNGLVECREMRIYVLEVGDDGKYGVFMNDVDVSTSKSVNRAFVDCGYAEVVPGSYIDVTFDMEKTLNSDMLNELEESFREVGLERENNLDENESEVSFSKADTFTKAYEESYSGLPIKGPVDKIFYKLVQIQSVSNNSEKTSKGEEESSKGLSLIAEGAAFSIASAVDRIDELGCIDLFPDEPFPTFPDDSSSLLSDQSNNATVADPLAPSHVQVQDNTCPAMAVGIFVSVTENDAVQSGGDFVLEDNALQDTSGDTGIEKEDCKSSETSHDTIIEELSKTECSTEEIEVSDNTCPVNADLDAPCTRNETEKVNADFQDVDSDPPSFHADDSDDQTDKIKEEDKGEQAMPDTNQENLDDSAADPSETSFEDTTDTVETEIAGGKKSDEGDSEEQDESEVEAMKPEVMAAVIDSGEAAENDNVVEDAENETVLVEEDKEKINVTDEKDHASDMMKPEVTAAVIDSGEAAEIDNVVEDAENETVLVEEDKEKINVTDEKDHASDTEKSAASVDEADQNADEEDSEKE